MSSCGSGDNISIYNKEAVLILTNGISEKQVSLLYLFLFHTSDWILSHRCFLSLRTSENCCCLFLGLFILFVMLNWEINVVNTMGKYSLPLYALSQRAVRVCKFSCNTLVLLLLYLC